MKPWVSYSLIRVGIFAAVFTVLMLLSVAWWLSAIVAAVVGASVSYIFFARQRDAVALSLHAARHPEPGIVTDDEAVEDKAVDQSADARSSERDGGGQP